MKLTRTLVSIFCVVLLASGCKREPETAADAIKENTNPLLAFVPADTAFAFAALEPVPEDITDAYLERFQPALDVFKQKVDRFTADYEAGTYQGNAMALLATAVLDELGGSLNAESLEKVGISMQSHHVVYGMGLSPVLRIGLTDEALLRAAIDRIEAKMGVEIAPRNMGGTDYWRLGDADEPVAVYIAILDQQLAVSLFHIDAEDRMLAAFLGHELPQTSLASTNALAVMNHEKGYTPYGSGYIDFARLADGLLGSTRLAAWSQTHVNGFNPASLDPVCQAELRSLVAKAPRLTAGNSTLTAGEIGMRYELEIESTLAAGLAALVSDIPAAEDGDSLLSASLGIQVGRLRTFLLEKAEALVASPFQCQQLQRWNEEAANLVAQLNIPMPPMINNLAGIRVRMDDFKMDMQNPVTDGLIAIHVDKPEMFVGMANMMVPGFESLDLANQSEPVKIPEEVMHMQGLDVYAMMNKDSIGIALGQQHARELGAFMSGGASGNGTFFSASVNLAKQVEIQEAMSEALGDPLEGRDEAVFEFSRAFRDSFNAMVDRSRVDMRLGADGLVVDTNISFK